MTLEAIRYARGQCTILDQLKLPFSTEYICINGIADGFDAIKRMQVRGAPAIAIVGALSLAEELLKCPKDSAADLLQEVESRLNYLVTARPTAVNLSKMCNKFIELTKTMALSGETAPNITERLVTEAENMLASDVSDNKSIGQFGMEAILTKPHMQDGVIVLTHCNTGSLATAGYGTALGVVRALHENQKLKHAYCTETRPYMQGARLTAYELVYEKMPSTLICDSMAAFLMAKATVNAVVVGADRVAANGDTANKIGTYQLAVVAMFHKVPFYVCAPFTSIDLSLESGSHIVIEERPSEEMTSMRGTPVAAQGIGCWNPAFDITPAALITGIVTEKGVVAPGDLRGFITDHV